MATLDAPRMRTAVSPGRRPTLPMRSRRPPAESRGGALEDRSRHELRSFGRRRGRKLSARQQHLLDEILPHISLPLSEAPPIEPTTLFSPPASRVWLEIGFGGGEH